MQSSGKRRGSGGMMPNFASPIWLLYISIPLASPFGGYFSIDKLNTSN